LGAVMDVLTDGNAYGCKLRAGQMLIVLDYALTSSSTIIAKLLLLLLLLLTSI
jgi:hypothetical protein